MKSKEFVLDEHTTFKVVKRSSSRNIRLTIGSSGEVKVSIPTWLPYKAAIDFVAAKRDWINKQRPVIRLAEDGQAIGKSHRLLLKPTSSTKVSVRVSGQQAVVHYPSELSTESSEVQLAAKRVIRKALLLQANNLLPIRLNQLAEKYSYTYHDLHIKSLKTRWGSCDSQKNITLNLYLMDLPWELIDYVILHELNHTEHLHHGPNFWQAIEQRLPNVKELRRELRKHKAGA